MKGKVRKVQHLGKILPVDGYQVQLSTSLPTDYLQSLMHLYQPLLGIEAVNLYQLLLHEIDIQIEESLQTHHTLMNYLNLSLDRIYEARLKLEGIGLLKTYQQENEDKTYYTYILQPPFRPQAFFQDMMLAELLYRHIGKSKFKALKIHYTKKTNNLDGQNVTAAFDDVFQTFKPSNKKYVPPVQKETAGGIPIKLVDFSLIKQSLQRKMIPVNKVLTETNKRIISQMIQLYDLEMYETENAIEWALTEENTLDIEQLKAACLDIFQSKHNTSNIQLSLKQQKVTQPNEQKQLSPEEKLQQRFETISPKELLEDLSSGNNASPQDLKLISEIMVSQGLSTPVMNVLIHYVMLQSNMKLPPRYMEKIASNWSRKRFKTAKEAMDFVQNQSEEKTKPRKNYYAKKQSKEIIPDWFEESKKQRQQGPSNKKEDVLTKEQKHEQEELIALLQRHASKNN